MRSFPWRLCNSLWNPTCCVGDQVLLIPTAAGFIVSGLKSLVNTFDDGPSDEPAYRVRSRPSAWGHVEHVLHLH